MNEVYSEYLLINSMIRKVGFEQALLNVCKSVFRYSTAIKHKKSKISAWLICRQIDRSVKRINQKIGTGEIEGNCVALSLYAFWVLSLMGVEPEIITGVRQTDKKIDAHMWIRCGNREINKASRTYQIIRRINCRIIIEEWVGDQVKNEKLGDY